LEVDVDSAGTGDWHVGHAPDPRAQATALRHGIDISGYRGRQVQAADFKRFTHILALDADNLAALRRLASVEGGATLALLLDYVPGRAGETVADPYYGDAAGFEVTWHDVETAARALVAHLRPDL
jgi:protein-tyrosine phosphatase